MSISPARIGRIDNHGLELGVGAIANLTVVDDRIERKVSEIKSVSKSSNNPYRDLTLPGKVLHTFLHGNLVVHQGELVRPL